MQARKDDRWSATNGIDKEAGWVYTRTGARVVISRRTTVKIVETFGKKSRLTNTGTVAGAKPRKNLIMKRQGSKLTDQQTAEVQHLVALGKLEQATNLIGAFKRLERMFGDSGLDMIPGEYLKERLVEYVEDRWPNLTVISGAPDSDLKAKIRESSSAIVEAYKAEQEEVKKVPEKMK